MNLPVILDVAIGLVFIYLILSLLASEIQELLTTLLQWRATHLKQSIQTLLTGGELDSEDQKVKDILSSLYNNPLLKGINHESKEGWSGLFRQFTWWIADGYGKMMAMMGKKTKILGEERSAPSYIPSETFANTLFDLLDINNLSHKLTSLNLSRLIENEIYLPIVTFIFDQYAKIHLNNRNYLGEEANILNNNLAKINDDFRYQKSTIETTIRKLNTELDLFIENCKRHFENSDLDSPESEAQFINKLTALRNNIFYNQAEILWRLKPTLNQMIDMGDSTSQFYQSIKADLGDPNSPIYQTFHEIEQHIENKFKKLPSSLRDTLTALAKKTELKVNKAELQIKHFQSEVESWFDKSMERAGGVYKRNAKGVAFLIGFAIAFLANADTLHIISRLSKDSALRNTIAQNAGQFIDNNPQKSATETKGVLAKTEKVLKEIPFPMGWESDNLQQQINWRWESQKPFPFQKIWKMIAGWMISGAAISMGSSFWFDILGKLINVRNTGSKPKSKSQTEETNE